MALIQAKAGLDASKNINAWSYRIVTPSISWQRATATNLNKTKLDGQAVEGAVALPYARGAVSVEWVPLDNDVAGIPVGYWRSVGCSLNTFAVESIVDMLAAAAGEDPFTFRIRRITDARTLAVLNAANTFTAWRKHARRRPRVGHGDLEGLRHHRLRGGRGVAAVGRFDEGAPRGLRGRLRHRREPRRGRGPDGGRHHPRPERHALGAQHIHRRHSPSS